MNIQPGRTMKSMRNSAELDSDKLEESIKGGLHDLAQPYLLRMGQLKNLYEGLEWHAVK